jgi:CheY-like chemotaxis protein
MAQLEKVLYVEDEEDIRTIAPMALGVGGGLDVQACASGAHALRVAQDYAPDLLLLDVMMPDMDGIATLQALRQIPALMHVPAVFMTAKVHPQEVNRYLSLGVLGVIPKPFDAMQLASQLRQLYSKTQG